MLASLRGFARVPKSVMTGGLSNIVPLSMHPHLPDTFNQTSEQKAKVSELIALKGAESIFRRLIPFFGLLFSFSAYLFVTVLLQV